MIFRTPRKVTNHRAGALLLTFIMAGMAGWLLPAGLLRESQAESQSGPDQRPLPSVRILIEQLQQNQQQIDGLMEKYTFTRTETVRELDKKGKVKKTEIAEYEVTPVAGRMISRLVGKNGKPLSEKEARKEDRRVQKEVDEILKEQQEKAAGRPAKKKDRNSISLLDFLQIAEITAMKRMIFQGQEVIALDFRPRPDAKPKGRGQEIAAKLSGQIMVDEAARQVARLEARLDKSFKIGGGLLASISPKSFVIFEQKKLNGQIWLPAYMHASFSGRVLFSGFNTDVENSYGNFRQCQVESGYEIKTADGSGPGKK